MPNHCQFDEEVLLDAILEKIGTTNKFAVEFGCHIGYRFSNTQYLAEKGWTVQQYGIEGEPLIDEFFTAENINDIFDRHEVPDEPDFMSIDIDGMDYYCWKAMDRVKPRVVCIEYNISRLEGIQEYNPNNKWTGYNTPEFGACKAEMMKLGEEKGYTLVSENIANLFFVKKELWGNEHSSQA